MTSSYQANYLLIRYEEWRNSAITLEGKPFLQSFENFEKAMKELGYQDGDLLRIKHFNIPDKHILDNIHVIVREQERQRLKRVQPLTIEQVQNLNYKQFGNTIFSMKQFKKLGVDGIRKIVEDSNAIVTKQTDYWVNGDKKNCKHYILVEREKKDGL